jgi:hypothetical protein
MVQRFPGTRSVFTLSFNPRCALVSADLADDLLFSTDALLMGSASRRITELD